jgi:hypothetical protein
VTAAASLFRFSCRIAGRRRLRLHGQLRRARTRHRDQDLTLGPVTGRLLAQMMTGDTPFTDLAPYRADRFRTARASIEVPRRHALRRLGPRRAPPEFSRKPAQKS